MEKFAKSYWNVNMDINFNRQPDYPDLTTQNMFATHITAPSSPPFVPGTYHFSPNEGWGQEVGLQHTYQIELVDKSTPGNVSVNYEMHGIAQWELLPRTMTEHSLDHALNLVKNHIKNADRWSNFGADAIGTFAKIVKYDRFDTAAFKNDPFSIPLRPVSDMSAEELAVRSLDNPDFYNDLPEGVKVFVNEAIRNIGTLFNNHPYNAQARNVRTARTARNI
jgi:hypothetical protein